MRYAIINSLLFLAVSPLGVVARPIDPNDLAGQWDPSGQYRKGQWQHGVFVANNGGDSNNPNGQVEQNSQWRKNNQNGWTDANGQWHTDQTLQESNA
ncbi:Cell wall/choline-binding repeat [Penicillium digitatum]|uniref:Secreted protein n=3 Tax=Penicillium digitatum TaxID=36651 RepID=K9FSW6_PEND2|nr:hypothetical protein PDIP_06350 [Penicillium digitatum Pd1]EKV12735.1 hypothetical protein PDIG_41710 [Penicillium digitatum PHI26]EKV21426.1 hypothetical protein PDIP_06350 [Penicillium digitatum Pd1]QQK46675.1 Cell wall/choline-binding repeat [Penicillium digitatum]